MSRFAKNVLRGGVLLVIVVCRPIFDAPSQNTHAFPQGQYVETSVCELVAHADSFAGKPVRVLASVTSDGLEHSALVDEACLGQGVALSISNEYAQKDWIVRALQEAISRLGVPGTTDRKKISGVFEGKFEMRAGEFPPKLIDLQRVPNLTIQLRDK